VTFDGLHCVRCCEHDNQPTISAEGRICFSIRTIIYFFLRHGDCFQFGQFNPERRHAVVFHKLHNKVSFSVQKKIKLKCSRYRSGVAQRVGKVTPLLFHDHGTRRGFSEQNCILL